MRSISTQFLIMVGAFALLFSGVILYQTWSVTRADMEAMTAREGALALEFDLAVREYVRDTVRPAMEQHAGKDTFVVETMSSSFVARSIFDKVHKNLPNYVLKFSSDNPRNPVNRAGPEELKMIRYFRGHPELTRWTGRLTLDGKEYMAHLSPMRMEKSCLHCHGRPEDAPQALIAKYGNKAGFHRPLGDVIGLDMVAIPLDKVNAALAGEAAAHLATTAIWLILLFASAFMAFRHVVARRLKALTEHFRLAAAQAETTPLAPLEVTGRDEIHVLASSFNTLAERLRNFHVSLEQRVNERTAALAAEVAERKRTQDALQKEQRSLRQLLDMYEGHRMLVAYELHDGVTQSMIGALMNLEGTLRLLPDQTPAEARQGFQTVGQLLRLSIDETRRLMGGLRPSVLDELGLIPAIDSLVLETQKRDGPEIEWVRDVQFDRLAAPLETTIFRIVQEGLTNTCRHSQSARVRIGLFQQGDRIRIEIEDWGVGFDPAKVGPQCFGLEGLRKRAELFGGQAVIDTAPGKGTRIAVDLPLVEIQPDETP